MAGIRVDDDVLLTQPTSETLCADGLFQLEEVCRRERAARAVTGR